MFNVKAYNKETEGATKVGNFFKVNEFACRDASKVVLINPELVSVLDEIRRRIGRPVYINSGYRTISHNRANGGATNSMHIYGCAADIRADKTSIADLHKLCEDVVGERGGVGLYSTFVHVDVRGFKARWKG